MAFLELLEEGNKRKVVRQKSQVVCVSSVAAYHKRLTAGFAYSATKAGVNHMMKVLGTLLSQFDIRVVRSRLLPFNFYL